MDTTGKTVEYAAFAVIHHSDDDGILVVRRPSDDEHLPDVWGLPARPVGSDEGFPEAVAKIGEDKLGVELEVGQFLARGTTERGEYILHGELYEATISSGAPAVPQAGDDAPGTQYVDWKWVQRSEVAETIREAALSGSLCTNLYLDVLGEDPATMVS